MCTFTQGVTKCTEYERDFYFCLRTFMELQRAESFELILIFSVSTVWTFVSDTGDWIRGLKLTGKLFNHNSALQYFKRKVWRLCVSALLCDWVVMCQHQLGRSNSVCSRRVWWISGKVLTDRLQPLPAQIQFPGKPRLVSYMMLKPAYISAFYYPLRPRCALSKPKQKFTNSV